MSRAVLNNPVPMSKSSAPMVTSVGVELVPVLGSGAGAGAGGVC
jgi:hypothetical protein